MRLNVGGKHVMPGSLCTGVSEVLSAVYIGLSGRENGLDQKFQI